MSRQDITRVESLGLVPQEYLTEALQWQQGTALNSPTRCLDFSSRLPTQTHCTLGNIEINFSSS